MFIVRSSVIALPIDYSSTSAFLATVIFGRHQFKPLEIKYCTLLSLTFITSTCTLPYRYHSKQRKVTSQRGFVNETVTSQSLKGTHHDTFPLSQRQDETRPDLLTLSLLLQLFPEETSYFMIESYPSCLEWSP